MDSPEHDESCPPFCFCHVERTKRWKALPPGTSLTNGGRRCDMAVGACSCGATHGVEEMRMERALELLKFCDCYDDGVMPVLGPGCVRHRPPREAGASADEYEVGRTGVGFYQNMLAGARMQIANLYAALDHARALLANGGQSCELCSSVLPLASLLSSPTLPTKPTASTETDSEAARQAIWNAAIEAAATLVGNHSCVSSCCNAQPAAGEAKDLADCLRKNLTATPNVVTIVSNAEPPKKAGPHQCRICMKPCRFVIIDTKYGHLPLPGYCSEHGESMLRPMENSVVTGKK